MSPEKKKNEFEISAVETVMEAGFDSIDDYLDSEEAMDSVVPACCKEGCEVEPDGRCEHGCPSILLKVGVI